MELTRLGFLKLVGFATSCLAFGGSVWANSDQGGKTNFVTKPKGMLIDLTQCIGCKNCQAACQKQNQLQGGADAEELSSNAWTVVKTVEVEKGSEKVKRFVRSQCFHCLEPACASACPVKALHKTPEGPVVYDAWKCIGCRYCMVACPFGIPKYEWEKTAPLVTKCLFCSSRLKEGQQPACAAACPTKATLFGNRDELLVEAERRINNNPNKYVNYIYGLKEGGGTSFLFLSDVPFKDLGFPTNIPNTPLPDYTWEVMSKIPGIIAGGGILLTSTYLLTHKNEGESKKKIEGKEA